MAQQQDDEDEEITTPDPEESQEDDSAEAAPEESAPAEPSPKKGVRDALEQKYGKASSREGINAARDEERQAVKSANLDHSLEGLFTAGSVAHGGPGASESDYQHALSQAHTPVAQAEEDRKNAIQDYLQQNNLGRQGAADEQKQKEWDIKNQANDPNSQQSQLARHVWEKANPDMHLDQTPGWEGMSAADMGQVKDPLDLNAKLKERALAAQQHADWMNAQIGQRDRAANGKIAAANDRAAASSDKADAKTSDKQGANYVKMNSEINGAGRAPPDFKQALKDQQSIDKANGLFKGDLNKLSDSQAALVAGELEKIATGSAGTEAGRQGLNPHTFQQNWNSFKNKFVGPGGQVSGANIGPFLQQQKDYLQELGNITNKRVNAYKRNVHDAYLDAGQITPEQSDLFKGHHPDLFPEAQQSVGQGVPAAPAQGNQQASGPVPPAAHPEVSAAVAWAKQNPHDARAIEIMKRVGGMNAGL